MDIAKLGVAIDPQKAVDGASRTKTALKEIGDTARVEMGKVDSSANRAGESTRRMGVQGRRGLGEFNRGIVDFLDGIGLMDNGIGRMIRRSPALSNSVESLKRGFAGLRTSGVDTMTGLSSSFTRASASGASLPPVLNATASSSRAAAGGTAAFGASAGALIGIIGAVVVVIGTLVAGFAALYGVISLVKKGMDLAGPVQLTTLSLKTMTGSAKEAQRIMESLRETSVRTGADLSGSSATVKRFLALGFNPDDAIKLNTSILDVAGSIGMSAEEAKLLGAALAQVQAKGVVSMEELRQQIAEKGVPVFDELAKKIGVTTGELIKLVEQGKVPAKELIDIFLNMEGGFAKFAGGAEKMTQTLPGAVGRLKAVWADLLITIGEPVNTALVPMVNGLSDMLLSLAPYAKAFGESLATGIRALIAIIQSGEITEALRLALAAGIEFAAANMVTLFQLQLIGLVKIVTSLFSSAIELIVGTLANALTAVFDFITKLIQGDWSGAMGVVADFFGGLFTGGGGIISNIAKSIYNSVGQALVDAANAFVQAFFKAWQAVDRTIQAGKAQFGIEATSLGPVAPKPIEFKPVEVKFADIRQAANDLVGTGNRDAFADYIKSKGGKPPGTPDIPLPGEEGLKTGDPTGTGTGEGKGGSIPKAKEVRELDTQVQQLIKDWTDLKAQMDNVIAGVGQSIAGNVTEGLMGLVDGTKDLKTAFSDMATSIINDIVRMVIQMYVQLAVAQALAAMGYGGTGGAGVATAHTGGVAGSRNLTTSGGVASYHTGGITTAEAMVKVERGETILTRKRASELEDQLSRRQSGESSGSGSGKGTTIINVTDASQVLDVIAANPDAIVNAISRRQPAVRSIVSAKERR